MRMSVLGSIVLSLSVVCTSPSQAIAGSPLEKNCIKSIDAVVDSYEHWVAKSCPIYVGVIERYLQMGRPDIALRLADIYEDAVSNVAKARIRAVLAIAASCEKAGGDVDEVAEEAIEEILITKEICLEAIFEPIDDEL